MTKGNKLIKRVYIIISAVITSLLLVLCLPISAAASEKNIVTVSFNSKGGSGYMPPVQLDVTNGARPPLPECSFTKPGYKFIGWATWEDGEPFLCDYGGYWYSDSKTLYAVWAKEEEVRKISFAPNGGAPQPCLYAKPGQTVYMPPPLHGKDNSRFRIYSDINSDNPLSGYAIGVDYTMPDYDVTFLMNWTVSDMDIPTPAREFANTTQWVKGLYIQEGVPIYVTWNPSGEGSYYYGWSDVSQGSLPWCWGACGTCAMHWWFDRNNDFVRYHRGFNDIVNSGIPLDTRYHGENDSDLWNFLSQYAGYEKVAHPMKTAPTWWLLGDGNARLEYAAIPDEKLYRGGVFKDVFSESGFNSVITKPSKAVFTKLVTDGLKNDSSFFGSYEEFNHAITIWGFHFDKDGYVDGFWASNSKSAVNPKTNSEIILKNTAYNQNSVKFNTAMFGDIDTGVTFQEFHAFPAQRRAWSEYYLGEGEASLRQPVKSTTVRPDAGIETEANASDLQSLLSSGEYNTIKLCEDVKLGRGETLTVSKSVTLDLNGRTITGGFGNPVITVSGGGDAALDVVIKDSSITQSGKITGGAGAAMQAGGVYVSGENTHLFLDGGEISGNRGMYGGMCVANGATVTMTGGKITDNRADTCMRAGLGGGVYVDGATFSMKGGEITGNFSNSAGGGVAVGVCGNFCMEGGVISDNITQLDYSADVYGGGGVAAYAAGGKAELIGGEISNNIAEGKASFGGGILVTYGGEVTVGGSIKIFGNKKDLKPSNITIDGDFDESLLKTSGQAGENIGVALLGDVTGKFLADGCEGNFVCDNPQYAVSGDRIIPKSEHFYTMEYDEDLLSVTYGNSFSFPVTALDNGAPAGKNGKVVLETANGRTVFGLLDDGGTAVISGSPIAGEYEWKIGENPVSLIWYDSGGAELSRTETSIFLGRRQISPETVVWDNESNRTEGDGKTVTASLRISGDGDEKNSIPKSDSGRVECLIIGHRAQEAGTHTAKVIGVIGERADYYELEPNLRASEFHKTYTISKGAEDVYTMIMSPDERLVQNGDVLSLTVFVKQGGKNCGGGKISLRLGGIDGAELASADVVDGMAKINLAADMDKLPPGRNTVTACYIPPNDNSVAATADSIAEMSAKELPRLFFEEPLEVSGKYPDCLKELAVNTNGKYPKTENGQEIKGEWHFLSAQEDIIPDCNTDAAYQMIFRPEGGYGRFAELCEYVTPKIEKCERQDVPVLNENNLLITSNSITVSLDCGELEYAVFKSGEGIGRWQKNPCFDGLTPNTQYAVYCRYAETPNYKAGIQSRAVYVKTTEQERDKPIIESFPRAVGVYGERLGEIKLAGGVVTRGGAAVDGEWHWENPQLCPDAKSNIAYTAIFTAFDTNETITASVYPDIAKMERQPAPPVLREKSFDCIALNKDDLSAAGTLYGIVKNTPAGECVVWQTDCRFTGLTEGTNYTFCIKYPETENISGGISPYVSFATEKAEPTENKISFAETDGGYIARLEFKGDAPDINSIRMFVVYYKNSALMYAESVKLENYEPKIALPEGYEDCDIRVYVWNNSNAPLMPAQALPARAIR